MQRGRRQTQLGPQHVLVLPVLGAVDIAEQPVGDAVGVAAVVALTGRLERLAAMALGRERLRQVALLGIEREICFIHACIVGAGLARIASGSALLDVGLLLSRPSAVISMMAGKHKETA